MNTHEAKSTRGKVLKINYESHPDYQFRVSAKERVAALLKYGTALALVCMKNISHYVLLTPDERSNMFLFGIQVARRYASHIRGYKRKGQGLRTEVIIQKLESDGIAVVDLTAVDTGCLHEVCLRAVERLRSKRGICNGTREFEESRETLKIKQDRELYLLLSKTFEKIGIIDAVSHYLQRECRLVEVTPQLNDISDSFWRQEEVESSQRCSYLHYDAFGNHIKVIVYLNRIESKEDGPFSYVKGSHRGISKHHSFLGSVIDQSGLARRDLYARRLFSSLPRRLRMKCAFGNDLSLNDIDVRNMMRREEVVFGDALSAIVFDVRGFHRGGMVERGERQVCTSVIG